MNCEKMSKQLEHEQSQKNPAALGEQSSPRTVGTTMVRPWLTLVLILDQFLSCLPPQLDRGGLWFRYSINFCLAASLGSIWAVVLATVCPCWVSLGHFWYLL